MAKKERSRTWFQRLKGFGFIDSAEGSVDVYVHYAPDDSDDDFRGLHNDKWYRRGKRRDR